MMVRLSFQVLLLLLSTSILMSQNGYSIDVDEEGPPMTFYNVLTVQDTIYVSGLIKDPLTGQWSSMVARIDTTGNLLGYEVAPDSLGDVYIGVKGHAFLFTKESNFVFVVSNNSNNGGLLLVFNSRGKFQFKKEYHFEYPDARQTHQQQVIELPNGYLIAGSQTREDYFSDMFVIKTDKQGNIVWYKTYGEPEVNEFCVDLQQVNENVFVLTGAEYNSVYLPVDERLYHSTLIYIDNEGNVICKWDAGINSEGTAGNYLQLGTNFVYETSTREIYEDEFGDKYFLNTPIIVRRDSSFHEVWTYTVECYPVWDNAIFGMEQLADGNFLAVGQWALPGHLPPEVKIHGCMLKISPEGEKIWSRCDTVPGYSFGYNKFWLCGVTELSSGSIVAAGGHDDTQLPGAKSYGWLVKVDKDGCMVDTLCTTTSLYEQILEREALQVSPNPASEAFQVTVPEYGLLSVISTDGRVIYKEEFFQGKHLIDCQKWPPGVYVVRLAGNKQYVGKVIVQ